MALSMDYLDILSKFKNLNFVDRLFNSDKYPQIKNKDGSSSTHKMATATINGKSIAFPTIVYDKTTKSLKELSVKEAADYALDTGEFIPFGSAMQARDFANNGYKRGFTKFSGITSGFQDYKFNRSK